MSIVDQQGEQADTPLARTACPRVPVLLVSVCVSASSGRGA